MLFLRQAWGDVSQSTIDNCFRHCGFYVAETDHLDEENVHVHCPEDLMKRLDEVLVEDVAVSVIDDYIVIDENLPVAGELTDEEIIATVQEGSFSTDEDIDDSDTD